MPNLRRRAEDNVTGFASVLAFIERFQAVLVFVLAILLAIGFHIDTPAQAIAQIDAHVSTLDVKLDSFRLIEDVQREAMARQVRSLVVMSCVDHAASAQKHEAELAGLSCTSIVQNGGGQR